MSKRYRLDGPDALSSCALEDMLLIYHRPSGQTHMVISPVPEILAALSSGTAMTATDVYVDLARHYDLGAAEEALAQVEAHLAELVQLGLARVA